MAETTACKRSKPNSHKNSLSWGLLRKIFSCKVPYEEGKQIKKSKKMGSSLSVCSMRHSPSVVSPETDSVVEVCHGSSRYHLRSPSKHMTAAAVPTSFISSSSSSSHSSASITASAVSSSSLGGSSRGMHLRKLSGCYECHVMVDPISGPYKVPSSRTNFCPCPDCDEVFLRAESLELHQAVRHAVSELAPEDASRNIIELIFYSSWIKNQTPSCKIDRIVKVHNTQRAITKFEEYRDSIKIKANKHARKHPRCAADGNELLRFYSTTLACSLGLHGSTSLCQSSKQCGVCSIIRDGFKVDEAGRIRTMATSGRAHGMPHISSDGGKRAMIVCRVIAGRVEKSEDGVGEYDSVTETCSNLDELFVFNPGAILPCFVVMYTSF
ncbi:uncharacterized protein LOC122047416 [Zingiber officinale]|uniref:C2H2-type domain-containing protein n=1 Tax=Zingiber officinale TaxID=94328 RepID=A0A8J5LQR6_ZINOF|nr:uncharacterized protein LOC122047416 [Zingiber officinale]KAG6526170.1 hypothetical protein ZIOFF_016147 [Zingiber officinale]